MPSAPTAGRLGRVLDPKTPTGAVRYNSKVSSSARWWLRRRIKGLEARDKASSLSDSVPELLGNKHCPCPREEKLAASYDLRPLSLSRCGLAASGLLKNHPLDALPSSGGANACTEYLTSSLYIGGSYPAKHLDALGNLMKKTGIKVQSRSLASSLHAGGVLALPARLPSHGGGDIIAIIIISRRDLRPASSCNGRRMHGWAHQVPSGLERAQEAWKHQVQGSAGKAKRTW